MKKGRNMSNAVEGNFKEKLRNKSLEHNIELNESMLEKMEVYKNLLLEWNEKINLTAITEEDEVILKHFIDSLECIKHIKRKSSIIDVGTGAGFPGLVLAIYFGGDLNVTLLDSLNKRTLFLQTIVDEIKLSNVTIVHGRAEETSNNQKYREKFDYVAARAVAGLNILLEFTSAFVRVGGKCLLMKGDNADEEIKSSKNSMDILHCKLDEVYKYTLKDYASRIEYNRNIAVLSKVLSTPDGYPRNYGRIKKNPL